MSGNVKFNSLISSSTKKLKTEEKPKSIIPHDFLVSLQGRRVLVFLSYKNHELEGTLSAVDADKGDIFLDEVVHYAWSQEASEKVKNGKREELRRCASAMVNNRYIEMIALA